MKKSLLVILLSVGSFFAIGQGVSFSYLVPANGYFAAPVSPFSIRGVGIGSGLISFETGFTLYYIPGLPIENLPFSSQEPLAGNQFAILVPVQAAFNLPIGSGALRILAGGFAVQHFFGKILEGNMDRALRQFRGWELVNSDLSISNLPGYGWMAGFEVIIPYNRDVSINIGLQYLDGSSASPLRGEYTGLNTSNQLITERVDFDDARTSLEGIELSLGVTF